MTPALLAAAMLVPTVALAEPVALEFSTPDSLPLFASARLFSVKGKSKSGCDAALQAALEEAYTKAGRKDHPAVVGVFDDRPRDDWVQPGEVQCDEDEKKAVVALSVVAVQPGEGYPEVTGQRTLEILEALAKDDPVLPTPVNQLQLVGLNGHVFYSLATSHDGVFEVGSVREERAIGALRDDIERWVGTWAERVKGVPEITGIRVVVTVNYAEFDDVSQVPGPGMEEGVAQHAELYEFYIPTAAALAFADDQIHERQLTDAAGVFLAPVEKGYRMDLSPRASELITGSTVNVGPGASIIHGGPIIGDGVGADK